MLNGDGIAQVIELHDAFFFCCAIGQFLSVREFKFRVPVDSRRHVFHHEIFGSPQNVFLGQLRELAKVRTGRLRNDLHELKKSTQFLGPIFYGCAGQSPASPSANRTSHFSRTRVAILDTLCLVENQQVKFRLLIIRDFSDIASHQFVVSQQYRNSGHGPQHAASWSVALDCNHGQFFSPCLEFSLPIWNQWFRADEYNSFCLPTAEQKSDGSDRLHGLAKPHLVGQQCRLAGKEPCNPFILIGEWLEGHNEFLASQPGFKGRLKQIEQAILQRQCVGRRLDSRGFARLVGIDRF